MTVKPQDFATGEATLTRDATTTTVPLSIVGGYASASVPNIEAGAWSLQVNFYNAGGQLSYTGTKAVTITAGRTLNTSITISATTGAVSINIELPDSQLVLWNTLGSQFEFENSQVGPALLSPSGSAYLFSAGKFGNGINLNPNDIFTIPGSAIPGAAGTIEFWIKANFSSAPGRGYFLMSMGVANGSVDLLNNGSSLIMNIFNSTTSFPADQIKIEAGKWIHIALTWNQAGLDSTGDTARIYTNGAIAAAASPQFYSGNRNQNYPIYVYGYGANDSGTIIGSTMDNLKIYHKAKTSYSDRNAE